MRGCTGGSYTLVWAYAASKTRRWIWPLTGKNSAYKPKNLAGVNLLSSYPYEAKVGPPILKTINEESIVISNNVTSHNSEVPLSDPVQD